MGKRRAILAALVMAVAAMSAVAYAQVASAQVSSPSSGQVPPSVATSDPGPAPPGGPAHAASPPAPGAARTASPPAATAPRLTPSAPGTPIPPRLLLDRSTPRQTVTGFLAAIDDGQPTVAAQYLDLSGLRWAKHASAAEAATQLAFVLRRRVALDIAELPDGPDDETQLRLRIASVDVNGRAMAIDLTRHRRGGQPRWLFAATTVSAIPELYASSQTQSWLEPLLPPTWAESRYGDLWGWQVAGLLLALFGALPIGLLLSALLLRLLERVVQRTEPRWDDTLLEEARGPIRFCTGWLAMGLFALSLSLPQSIEAGLTKVVSTPLILATGWVLMRVVKVATVAYLENVPDDLELKTRGLRTQLVILRRLSSVVIGIITISVALMQFEVVRSVGWSLLASAGVAGVALGFAAQRSLGAVIAGLQLSITQPLRLGDAIVVQGEWGEVEEISLTYVRVKLYDERRLVVPIEKFLSESFENWSKPGDLMTGVVELAVDPSLPFAALREELERIAQAHPHHDGREHRLQVIEQDERRALVRCRISTNDISKTFQLRCDIREQLLSFLQELEDGRYLPRQRWEQIDADA